MGILKNVPVKVSLLAGGRWKEVDISGGTSYRILYV